MNQLQFQLCVSTKTTQGPALSPARALLGGLGSVGPQSGAGAAEPSSGTWSLELLPHPASLGPGDLMQAGR